MSHGTCMNESCHVYTESNFWSLVSLSPGSLLGQIVSLSELDLIFERNKGTLVMVLAVWPFEALCVNCVFSF